MKRTALLATLCAGLAACDGLSLAAPQDYAGRRVVGILSTAEAGAAPHDGAGGEAEESVTAPDTVLAGIPFQVTVSTWGRAGCWHPDGALLAGGPLAPAITPFDFVRTDLDGHPVACGPELVRLHRTVHVLLPVAGTATLRVHGRRIVDWATQASEPLTIEKAIAVR